MVTKIYNRNLQIYKDKPVLINNGLVGLAYYSFTDDMFFKIQNRKSLNSHQNIYPLKKW